MSQVESDRPELSGFEKGEVNLGKVNSYLQELAATGRSLPMEGGRPNISAISVESGVKRNAFYTNKRIKELLSRHVKSSPAITSELAGVTSHYQEQIERRDRRILQLEQQLDAVKAENLELREHLSEAEQRLERYQIIEEEVLKAGRRVIP